MPASLEYLILTSRVYVFSRVWLFATPWAVALQAPLSMGIFQARVLEWVAMPCSRGSSQPREWTRVSWTGRWILYHLSRQGAPSYLMKCESHSTMSDSLWLHGLYSPWNSLGQHTGVGSLSLLQGIFPTQGLNPGLLHYRQILYQLSHKRSLISYTIT